MEQYNIKPMVTSHGLNDWLEAQKVWYFIKGIKTNPVNNFLDNISRSAALRNIFAAEARHVVDFLVIMNYRNPGSNRNVLGVDTYQVGCGGRGRGEVPRRWWRVG